MTDDESAPEPAVGGAYMLRSEREKERQFLRREAAGESLWTDAFPKEVRVTIWRSLAYAIESVIVIGNRIHERSVDATERIHTATANRVRDAQRVEHLVTGVGVTDELQIWLNSCADHLVPDVIEAALNFGFAPQHRLDSASLEDARTQFRNRVADVLRSDRIGWRIVEDRMVPFKSFELHVAVVEPTLLLLGGNSKFAAAEKSYQDALHEIARGNAADAITDASRALEETFEALGCDGNALGDRIKDARKKGLIAAHDDALVSPLEKFFHWASADRSEKGDTHTSPTTDIDDAWLTVHIVGALVMRLAQGTRRAP